MTLRWLLAALHLLALPLGMTAVWMRASALSMLPDERALKRAFSADAVWGAAAGLWLVTGLIRAFAGLEKGSDYYLSNHVFWTKIALFLLVFALEIRPMTTLIRWRVSAKRGQPIDFSPAPGLARTSRIQAWILVLIVLAATAMARGIGA